MTTECTKKTSVWIGDLHDHSNGVLRGKWIELTNETTLESLQNEVNAMLAEANGSCPHTDYFIGDRANLPISGKHHSFEALLKIASLVRLHGYDIVEGFIDRAGIDAIDSFEDAFIGIYASLDAYTYEFIQEEYDLDKMLGSLASYFDYEAFARDLDLGGVFFHVDVHTSDGIEVAIFNSHF